MTTDRRAAWMTSAVAAVALGCSSVADVVATGSSDGGRNGFPEVDSSTDCLEGRYIGNFTGEYSELLQAISEEPFEGNISFSLLPTAAREFYELRDSLLSGQTKAGIEFSATVQGEHHCVAGIFSAHMTGSFKLGEGLVPFDGPIQGEYHVVDDRGSRRSFFQGSWQATITESQVAIGEGEWIAVWARP